MGTLLHRPLSILLVDDDEDMLRMMQYKLRSDGFRVTISLNGEDIWEQIQDRIPDLILLDIHMNGVEGGSLCALLKSNPVTCNIRVIMFSSNDDIEKITRECGANGFIPKSIAPNDLKQQLLNMVA